MQAPRPEVEEVEVDPRLPPTVQSQIVQAEIENARKGRRFGFVIVILGVAMSLIGATGVVDLNLSGLGLSAKVANATPGVVLMLIGLMVIWRTNLRITKAKGK
jgi:hypothetical protein